MHARRPTTPRRSARPRTTIGATPLVAVLVLAGLLVGAALAQEPPTLEGTLPPGLPGDAAVLARPVGDSGPLGAPLARVRATDGAFALTLPAEVPPEAVVEERVGCETTAEIVMLPALSVVGPDGAPLGGLWLTDVPAQLWGASGPPRSSYWIHVDAPLTLDETCGGTTVRVDFAPGWNRMTATMAGGAYTIEGGPPPASFGWTFKAAE